MNTPDAGPASLAAPIDPGALASGAGAPSSAPDVSVIAQLANALFKALPGQPPAAGGIVPATPAAPSTLPAPHALPAQPSTPTLGAYAPAQPPLGPIDGPPTAIPSSSPGPLFGGASSPSAPPAPFSQPTPPAFLQVAQPTSPTSPFATEPDLRALPRFFESALTFAAAPPTHPAAPALGAEAPAQPPINPIETPTASIASSPSASSGFSPASQVSQPASPSSPFASEADLRSLPRFLESALAFASPGDSAAAPAPDSVAPDGYYFLNEGRSAPTPGQPAQPAQAPEVSAGPLAVAPEFLLLRADQVPDFKGARRPFDARSAKRDFPILQTQVHGRPLVWLDNGATTQKPRSVIDRLSHFYENENSNIHRAAHTLAARATDAYEGARDKVKRFIGAGSPQDIIFVRGATEGINLVAQSWGRRYVKEGDEIVITWLEHHANIVPWQQLAAESGARLRVAPVDDNGDVRLDEYEKLLGPRTRIVAITQVSNALGTITPAREMTAIAHRHGARVLIDGAQSICHMPINVQELDCDFFVFSGHKMFAPTGIGVVYGKPEVLAATPPWQGGGNMIADVTFEKTVYQAPPGRFEAGTGNIADAVGLGAAIDYLESIGMATIAAYEHELLLYAQEALRDVPGLKIIGAPREKAAVISFVLDGCRSEDVGQALDREGIAVRAGHHCAQPILRRFGLESSVRASLALYNTKEDVDALAAALHRIASQRGLNGR
ncbi:family 2A encapsulin nanocompartment cargo protein cysteine desulfurase [Methylocapsa sp. S129]|uniref:family 2A encapsulin nanocompartment cargo protein cysteine desulfurase n=1 Tax=Methylocapsa sp. S129 TaxID=1641869 RepID=UPI00131C6108|nr:family 2A encapsulin nanocompartment cargo protein cysteine desulfurase [Methylocapsa sp. S129]